MVERKIIWPQAGAYVVAVSGGIDSMVLLDILATAPARRGYQLTVAHFDHGMRPESAADATFVEEAARAYGADYVGGRSKAKLAGEDQARQARHAFLRGVLKERPGAHLVTAHHQDDLIETSLLNLARGTGWEGLAPLRKGGIVRPLLGVSRVQIAAYAKHHQVWWHEDASNADRRNPRNFVRHELLARADHDWRKDYLNVIAETAATGTSLAEAAAALGTRTDHAWTIERRQLAELSLEAVGELIVRQAKRLEPSIELERRLVLELALFARTARPGKSRPVRQGLRLEIARDTVALCNPASAQKADK